MNRILLAIVFLSCLLPQAGRANESEIRDFSMRVGAGALQGVGDSVLPEFSIYADLYFLSQDFRMLFGFSIYDTSSTDIPTLMVQSLGVEQNIPLGKGDLTLGVLYNKSYLENKTRQFTPQRGYSLQLGYKFPMARFQDLVLTVGQQYKPVSINNNLSMTKLDEKPLFARVSWQWYF